MVGLWHPELRAEAWVTPALIPEGWVGRDFIGEGGEEPPEPPVHLGLEMIRPVGPGYLRVRRRFWWRAA